MAKLRFMTKKILLLVTTLCLGGCLGTPKSVTPINGFELNRYLGKWYEAQRDSSSA